MRMMLIISAWFLSMFQSPRSGKFVSDLPNATVEFFTRVWDSVSIP